MSRFVAFSVGSLLFLTHWVWAGEGYDVKLRDVSPQTVVCLKSKTTMDKISQEMGRLYGQIFQYLGSQKISPTGPALAVQYPWVGQELDLEACVPVAEGVSEKGQIKVRKLAGGPMARVIHLGPHEKIGGAYDAIKEWMNKNGYKSDGPCREVFLVGPPSNPSDYKTEILWPVKKKQILVSPHLSSRMNRHRQDCSFFPRPIRVDGGDTGEAYLTLAKYSKERFADGMKIKIIKQGGRGFVEYIPGEYAWRAVNAKGYMFIHCLWVKELIKHLDTS